MNSPSGSELGGGEQIGRYHLVAEIASGGMATVYLARLAGMAGFQRTVAVKRLHPHLAKNAEFVQMFFDEARLAALIHHPNVVPIIEVGEGERGYYLVMEYIEGDTLASLLSRAATKGQRIPLRVSLRICIDMLQGLHAAHELCDERGAVVGLVHRDVSPQNVLVGTDGITRITDFGVARAASRLSATRAGQLKGKLAYMAPEQARGEEDVDRRTDIFAAGVVLWEALAFKRLFKADNHVATLNRVLSERIVSPRRLNPEVSESIAAVCLKALQRDVNLRFVSCLEFADALERAAQAAGALATSREVAAHVDELVGESVTSHRVAIRDWMDRRSALPESGTSPSRPPDYSQRPAPHPSRAPTSAPALRRGSGAPTPPPPVSSLRPPPSQVPAPVSVVPPYSAPPPPPSSTSWPQPGSSPVAVPNPVAVPMPAAGSNPVAVPDAALSAAALPAIDSQLALRSEPPAVAAPPVQSTLPPPSKTAVSTLIGSDEATPRKRMNRAAILLGIVLAAAAIGIGFFLGGKSNDAPRHDTVATKVPATAVPSVAPVSTRSPEVEPARPATKTADALEDLPVAEPEPPSVVPPKRPTPAKSSVQRKRPKPFRKKKKKLEFDNPYK